MNTKDTEAIPFDILLSFAQSLILFSLALMFLILMQQMVMITKTGNMKMLTRMGMITWAGLAKIDKKLRAIKYIFPKKLVNKVIATSQLS